LTASFSTELIFAFKDYGSEVQKIRIIPADITLFGGGRMHGKSIITPLTINKS